jgi:MFS family permease
VLTLQVGGLVNSLGNGMVIPFMFIYLHNVRGIGLGVAGLIVATHAIVSIVTSPVFGSQIDRFGGKAMLALSLVILSVGYAGYTLVHTPWQGFLVALVSGTGVGGFWPSQSTLITGHTAAHQRPAAFAMQRVVMNLGVGLGALVGGLIAATDSPGTFTTLFLLDSATFLVYAGVMVALVPEPLLGDSSSSTGGPGSYRAVLPNRAFLAVIGLNALFIFAGYSGFDVLPAYAKNDAGLTENQIGLLFFLNTSVVVLAQLPIAGLARGRRRMPTLALFGLLWAGAWLVVPVASATSSGVALAILASAMVVFGIGECLHATVAAPLVTDLAEPRLLGRYMALNALSWNIGFALGPALGGIGLSTSPTGVWIVAAALCAIGAACALAIEGTLPVRARRTPLPTPAAA